MSYISGDVEAPLSYFKRFVKPGWIYYGIFQVTKRVCVLNGKQSARTIPESNLVR